MQMTRTTLLIVVSLILQVPALGSLLPQDVVVVYNNSTLSDNDCDWSASKAVADYYCAARGIPSQNVIGVTFPFVEESITPERFCEDIAVPLRTFLSSRSGFDVNNPATDPTKAIVLCYGIPLRIEGDGRLSAVDSALSLLFNTTPWGREPIGGYANPYGGIASPYRSTDTDPAARTKPGDFGAFRASSFNHVLEPAPHFTIVRFLDATHAVAAGERGMLYRGTLANGTWTWDAVKDSDKGFLFHDITDICVVDSQHFYMCSWAA